MNNTSNRKYLVLLCLAIIALAIIDINNVQVSRDFAFFFLSVAAIFIGPHDSPYSRPIGLLLQIPFMTFLEKYHGLSTDPDMVLCIIYFICLAVMVFSIQCLHVKNAVNLALSLAAATVYSVALAKIELELLVLPVIVLNLLIFVILFRTGNFREKVR